MGKKILSIINEVFLDEDEDNKKKNVESYKIFYDIDVYINREGAEEAEQTDKAMDQTVEVGNAQEKPAVGQQSSPMAQPAFSVKTKKKILKEDEDGKIFKKKDKGIISLSQDESDNIHSLDDIFVVASKQKNKEGQPLFPEEVGAIAQIVISEQRDKISEFLKTEDKVILTLDYGKKLEYSVGVKISKLSGGDSLSVMMRKDGKVLADPFSQDLISNLVVQMGADE